MLSDSRVGSVDGFTLIEVVVAMVILALGLLGLEALGIGAARSIATADRQSGYATIAKYAPQRVTLWKSAVLAGTG